MVQNHKAMLVLGLLIWYVGEAANPVRKQMISGNVVADADIDFSDMKQANFIRKQVKADGNIDASNVEAERPIRKHAVSWKIDANGEVAFSDPKSSLVRKQMRADGFQAPTERYEYVGWGINDGVNRACQYGSDITKKGDALSFDDCKAFCEGRVSGWDGVMVDPTKCNIVEYSAPWCQVYSACGTPRNGQGWNMYERRAMTAPAPTTTTTTPPLTPAPTTTTPPLTPSPTITTTTIATCVDCSARSRASTETGDGSFCYRLNYMVSTNPNVCDGYWSRGRNQPRRSPCVYMDAASSRSGVARCQNGPLPCC